MNFKSDFVKELGHIDYSKSPSDIFSDFLRLSSIAIVNSIFRSDELEKEYLKTAGKYNRDQLDGFARLLALTVDGLEYEGGDFLGEVYMDADMGNSHLGQFFTPFSVCRMMAEINLNDFPQKPDRIISISDPCVGGGAIILACVEYFKQHDIDFQNWVYVEAIDISESAFRMAYIQLSLVGVAGEVVWGNTLSMERFATWPTPMYAMTMMELRRSAQYRRERGSVFLDPLQPVVKMSEIRAREQPDTVSLKAGDQLTLF